jgi:hypothetical protein
MNDRECLAQNLPTAEAMTRNFDLAQQGNQSAADAFRNELSHINASGGQGCKTPENIYSAIYNVGSDKPGNTNLQLNMSLDRSAGPGPEDARLVAEPKSLHFPAIKGFDK